MNDFFIEGMLLKPYYDTDEEEYHYVKSSSVDVDHQHSTERTNNVYRDERSGLLYKSPGDHNNDEKDDYDDYDDDNDESEEDIILTNTRNQRL